MPSTETHDMRELRPSGEGFNARTKIDGFWSSEAASDHQPADSKYDLRKSMAWDSAFFASPGVLDSEELFQTLNFRDSGSGVRKYENNLQKLPSESVTKERTSRTCECNARRSLAWDNAFFTSQGVLDLEELCLVNKGFKKSEARSLPCGQEELWRSTESSTTIGSEYSLDSLEFELFDGMKASLLKPSNTSKDGHSRSQLQKGVGTRKLRPSRKSNVPSKTVRKSFPVSGRQIVQTLGEERITKDSLSQSGRTNLASSPKPSTMPDQADTLAVCADKKVILRENNAKPGNRIRKAASGQNLAKKPCLGELCREPQALSKSPRSASHCRGSLKESAGSDSGFTSISKSSQSSLRRKKDMGLAACNSNLMPPPKCLTSRRIEPVASNQSIPKSSSKSPLRNSPKNPLLNSPTPSKSSTRSITESLNSSTDVLPTPKSLCRSPCVSIIEVNSTVFLKDVSVGCEAHETSDIGNQNCNKSCFENVGNEFMLPPQQVGHISKGSSPLVPTVIKDTQPSGLRKPSPKLGYFDVEIFTPPSPVRDMKFHSEAYTSKRGGLQSNVGRQGQESDGIMKNKEKKFKSTKEFLHDVQKPYLGQNEDATPLNDHKENLCSIHSQIDGLSRSVGAIGLS